MGLHSLNRFECGEDESDNAAKSPRANARHERDKEDEAEADDKVFFWNICFVLVERGG
jgi:hypothetical protein